MTFLLPTSLVMRSSTCFYCGAEDENDERTLGHTFGIRYCAEHKASAKRDSRAYLHSKYKVRVQDALRHEVLGPFFRGLLTEQVIRRTNGVLEGGWTLLTEEQHAIFYKDDEWRIPMIHRGNDITKGVALSIFQEERASPFQVPLQVPLIQETLNEGIYKADYDAQQGASLSHVPETEGIGLYVNGGEILRLFGDI
jgi:hypothetical protein